MKKTLAILLALVLVLVNVAALAQDTEEPAASSYTPVTEGTTQTIKLKKEYTVNGASVNTLYPAETLTFTAAKVDGPAYDELIEASAIAVNTKSGEYTVTITFPPYNLPGLYHYTLTETAPNPATQGVSTYDSTPIKISVLVVFDETDPAQLVVDAVGITKPSEGGEKDDKLENVYDLGKLTVTKAVSGNMADLNNPFKITVTLSSTLPVLSAITITADDKSTTDTTTIAGNGWTGNKTVELTIKNGGNVVFTDLPAGVTYTVVESDEHVAADATGSNGNTGYTRTYANDSGSIAKESDITATVTNVKNMEIDTGVSVEIVPYIAILAVTMIGAALLVLRKREEY